MSSNRSRIKVPPNADGGDFLPLDVLGGIRASAIKAAASQGEHPGALLASIQVGALNYNLHDPPASTGAPPPRPGDILTGPTGDREVMYAGALSDLFGTPDWPAFAVEEVLRAGLTPRSVVVVYCWPGEPHDCLWMPLGRWQQVYGGAP